MKLTKKILISTFNMYKGGSLSIYDSIKQIIYCEENIYELGCQSFCNNESRKRQILINYPIRKFNFIYRIIVEQIFVPVIALWCQASKVVMLGNFPAIFWFGEQNVFFHNTLYLRPNIKNNGIKFFLEASFFKIAIRLKKPKLLVQTREIERALKGVFGTSITTHIVGAPQQESFEGKFEKIRKENNQKIKFFYPAFLYPHKNHELLFRNKEWFIENNVEIYLTIEKLPEEIDTDDSPFICTGILSKVQINEYYNCCDALLFPSLEESLGLPLLEAVEFSLPIIAANLSYSLAAIENFYKFNINDEENFRLTLKEFFSDLDNGRCRIPNSAILKTKLDFFKGLVE